MLKKATFSPAQPRRAETRLTQVCFSSRRNPQRSPLGKSCSASLGRASEKATPPVFSRLRPRWVAFLSILLFLTVTPAFSEAQLDQLKKSKALEQLPTVEAPMVEIPAGEFAM